MIAKKQRIDTVTNTTDPPFGEGRSGPDSQEQPIIRQQRAPLIHGSVEKMVPSEWEVEGGKTTRPRPKRCTSCTCRNRAVRVTSGVTATLLILSLAALLGYSLSGGFHTLGQVINNLLETGADTTNVMHTVTHLVGREYEEVFTAFGKDFDTVKNPVLALTDTIANHAASMVGGVSNATDDALSTLEAMGSAGKDTLNYATWQLRYAAWVMSCLFKSADECSNDFYGKFHLCGHADKATRVDGRLVVVHEPCKDAKWNVVWDDGAKQWERGQTLMRLEHCTAVASAALGRKEIQTCMQVAHLPYHIALGFGSYRNCDGTAEFCRRTYCLDTDGHALTRGRLIDCLIARAGRTKPFVLDTFKFIDGFEDDATLNKIAANQAKNEQDDAPSVPPACPENTNCAIATKIVSGVQDEAPDSGINVVVSPDVTVEKKKAKKEGGKKKRNKRKKKDTAGTADVVPPPTGSNAKDWVTKHVGFLP